MPGLMWLGTFCGKSKELHYRRVADNCLIKIFKAILCIALKAD